MEVKTSGKVERYMLSESVYQFIACFSFRWSSSFSFVSIRANRGSNRYACLGTQSPDAVNKLLRLSNSNHQTKARAPQRLPQPSASSSASSMPTSSSVSPLISTSATSTGLSSLAEPSQHHRHHHHHHTTKVRDTNKLTSESSSLNLKPSNSAGYTQRIRSQTRKLMAAVFSSFDLSFPFEELNQNNHDSLKEGGGDSGRGSLNSTDTCMFDRRREIFHCTFCVSSRRYRRK